MTLWGYVDVEWWPIGLFIKKKREIVTWRARVFFLLLHAPISYHLCQIALLLRYVRAGDTKFAERLENGFMGHS